MSDFLGKKYLGLIEEYHAARNALVQRVNAHPEVDLLPYGMIFSESAPPEYGTRFDDSYINAKTIFRETAGYVRMFLKPGYSTDRWYPSGQTPDYWTMQELADSLGEELYFSENQYGSWDVNSISYGKRRSDPEPIEQCIRLLAALRFLRIMYPGGINSIRINRFRQFEGDGAGYTYTDGTRDEDGYNYIYVDTGTPPSDPDAYNAKGETNWNIARGMRIWEERSYNSSSVSIYYSDEFSNMNHQQGDGRMLYKSSVTQRLTRMINPTNRAWNPICNVTERIDDDEKTYSATLSFPAGCNITFEYNPWWDISSPTHASTSRSMTMSATESPEWGVIEI